MSQAQTPDERRHFTRVPFDATVTISRASDSWQAQLLDISLNGILLSLPENWPGQKDQEFQITLELDSDVIISVNGKVTHIEAGHSGFTFENMELDSASHLKRLLLFNLGDQSLIDRELHELISVHATYAPGPQSDA